MWECEHVTGREKERERVTGKREGTRGKREKGGGKTENGKRKTDERGGEKSVGFGQVTSNGLRMADNIAYNTLYAVSVDDATYGGERGRASLRRI